LHLRRLNALKGKNPLKAVSGAVLNATSQGSVLPRLCHPSSPDRQIRACRPDARGDGAGGEGVHRQGLAEAPPATGSGV